MRLAMRVVALTDATPGTVFTPGGTLGILAAVTVLLFPIAALFLAVRRFFSGSPLRRGTIFGLWLIVPGLVFPAREAFQIGFVPLNVVMFGSMFVLYGVVLSVTVTMLERRVRRPRTARASFPRPAPPNAAEAERRDMAIASIDVAGIEKRFGRNSALGGVTLQARSGITGLLGPNGAGKTTLLRIIATVLAPDRGKLHLLGRDPSLADERVEIRRRLGYVPQEPGFYRNFTAFEFVDYVAVLKTRTDRRARRDEVRRVLSLVGLADVHDRKVKALSGGMRRRLVLAQALLGDPDLLVLDEPISGLDPEQRLRFREVVSQLPNQPVVVLSTHQTEDVTALCEHVIVLHGGVIQFDGTPEALAETARARVWIAGERDPGARLSWRTGDGRYRHIGDPPGSASITEPSLDDAYLLMVGGPDPGREVAA
jgi:ABC-2 type transport system ATP-binding protein